MKRTDLLYCRWSHASLAQQSPPLCLQEENWDEGSWLCFLVLIHLWMMTSIESIDFCNILWRITPQRTGSHVPQTTENETIITDFSDTWRVALWHGTNSYANKIHAWILADWLLCFLISLDKFFLQIFNEGSLAYLRTMLNRFVLSFVSHVT